MLKLHNFVYTVENIKTRKVIKMDNYNNPVTENDDMYTDINITLKYEYVTFDYSSSVLESIKKEDWTKLISQDGFELKLRDSYGSHCDNGCVTIKNLNNDFLLFCNDTATGGDISVEIPINKCRNAIEEIASKY